MGLRTASPRRPRAALSPRKAPPGLAARSAALDLILTVLRDRRPLDDVLAGAGRTDGMAHRDRAFARLVATTTLRRLGQIDAVLGHFVAREPMGSAAEGMHLLRIGAAQILFLDTPAHAAVSTALALADARGWSSLKGMINAVLRRVDQEGPAIVASQDAVRLSAPDWLWSRWAAAYGEPVTRRIAEAHLAEPSLDLTPRDRGDASVGAWADRLEARVLPTGSLRRRMGGAVPSLPGYAEGAWWVQDAAAALPAQLLGDVAGRHVIDLCAAPGGKTAQLAAAGATVTAVDRDAGRLGRLGDNLDRLALSARLVEADARSWTPDEPADAVLLDAPCSATGTIRRHPDILHLKTAQQVEDLAKVQAELLRQAVTMVRPGGRLVWCTCSLLPEEGEQQIERLIDGGALVVRDPVDAGEIGGLAEAVTEAGEVRTLPCHLADAGGLDGFHISRLRRTG